MMRLAALVSLLASTALGVVDASAASAPAVSGSAVSGSAVFVSTAVGAGCVNGVVEVRGSTMVRLDAVSGRWVPVATLPETVNALAYAPGPGLFYGIAGDRLVTVDPSG